MAAQYDMDYSPPGDPDPACLTGNGDITEVTAEVCRTMPFAYIWDARDGIEAACLFPFTLEGESHDTCIMDAKEDFTRPVFRCPTRTVKGAGTDYTELLEDFGGCPTNR